jgi:ubiquinone/menaquinone biosynthesis C-methylase UbiE
MNKKQFWKDIWDSKGASDSADLLFLDGYDHLEIVFDSQKICDSIIELTNTNSGDSILEVGCGAGFLAKELQHYNYVGVDYSQNLVNKHLSLFPTHNIITSEANRLPFKDNFFDLVFSFGVFQYFPDKTYADESINEMSRVSKNTVFLGDLKRKASRDTHFVYPVEELNQDHYEISDCIYNPKDKDRFNVTLRSPL